MTFKIIKLWTIIFCIFLFPATSFGATLFQESFDNASFASRGWYDATNGIVSTTEHITGSTGSFECRFTAASTKCTGTAMRHKFTESDSIYISYWIKHSTSWVGSGKPYHPHMFLFLTNENSDYSGLAYTRLTAYVEENQGYPQMLIQDGQNIDETKINVDLIGITENRSVAGCNGVQANIGSTGASCYLAGSVHWNGIGWRALSPYFFGTTFPNNKNDWHFMEAYFKLNSISGGIGQSDGIVQYWYDGQLLIDHSNVIIRTGSHSTMKFNQFILAPYIGDGSPVDQTLWFDDLTVATNRAGQADATPPSVPTNLSATAVSSSQINLSWTASTDNVGVTGYGIYRNSAQIGTSAVNSYSDTGLAPSTTYIYTVAAYDAAGNVSGQSSSASATTQAVADTTPPAAPQGATVS